MFDNECVTQLLDAYRMDNVLDSDGSNTNSEAVSVVSGSESESGEENRDQSKWSDSWQLTASIMDGRKCRPRQHEKPDSPWTRSWIHLRLPVFWRWTQLQTIHGWKNRWQPNERKGQRVSYNCSIDYWLFCCCGTLNHQPHCMG